MNWFTGPSKGKTSLYWIGILITTISLSTILIDFFIPAQKIQEFTSWVTERWAYSWIETVLLMVLPIALFFLVFLWRKTYAIAGFASFFVGLLLLSLSPSKTPVDVTQAFGIPIAVFIGGLLLKQRDESVQHERQDRQESATVLDSYTEAMATINMNTFRTDLIKIREITMRTHHALMRVVKKDKLRIIIMLMQDNLIDRYGWIISLVGADLSGIDFRGYAKDLAGLNFSEVNLTGAIMKGKNFENCDFSKADLSGIDFEGVDLSGCDLSHAIYDLTSLRHANLIGAKLTLNGCTIIVKKNNW